MRKTRSIKHVSLFNSLEFKRRFFKKTLTDSFLSLQPSPNKLPFFLLLGLFSVFSSISRQKSFCLLSGKARSVFRKFALGRISFRHVAMFAKLNGLTKASW